MAYYLAIDLGNLNTQLALLFDSENEEKLVNLLDSDRGLETFVMITEQKRDDGHFAVEWVKTPEGDYAVEMIKRVIQTSQGTVQRPLIATDSKKIRSTTTNAMLEAVINKAIEKAVKLQSVPDNGTINLVFTYPADWSTSGAMSDLEHIEMLETVFKSIRLPRGMRFAPHVERLPEPCAAAFFSLDRMVATGASELTYGDFVIVYDFGHGTTDVALVKVVRMDGKEYTKGAQLDLNNVAFECVHATANPTHGGNEYAEKIMLILRNKIINAGKNPDEIVAGGLKQEVLRAMVALTDNDSYTINCQTRLGDIISDITITREEFVYNTDPEIEESIRLLEDELNVAEGELEKAGCSKDMLKYIVITGGGSNIPHFRAAVDDYVGQRTDFPKLSVNRESSSLLAIANGAAKYAMNKKKMMLTLGFTYAVQTETIVPREVSVMPLFEEGTLLPAEKDFEMNVSLVPNTDRRMEMRIHIYAGEKDLNNRDVVLNIINGRFFYCRFRVNDGIERAKFKARVDENCKITVEPITAGVTVLTN